MVVLFKLSILIIVPLGFIQFLFTDKLFNKKQWYMKVKKYIFWIDLALVFLILLSILITLIKK